jgi:protein translocase SecG subunit|uniref:Preprotein translocase SecG subunit n=1 Tax=Tenuicylindrus belgicus TaxID=1398096 RepID=UPI002237A0F3|nr:Preprotein translocase SecG subunit [Tenuicylindrus belgicus]UYC31589.1 Preprotein translocase SecG subunit [Tenuicylindrus belgicus]
MLKAFWLIISILLIILIIIRIPQNTGLGSISQQTNFLGSPTTARKILDNLTWLLIISYIVLAAFFNIQN